MQENVWAQFSRILHFVIRKYIKKRGTKAVLKNLDFQYGLHKEYENQCEIVFSHLSYF